MKKTVLSTLFILCSLLLSAQYYPSSEAWEEKEPEEAGLKPDKLQEAVDFAMANEYSGPKDLRIAIILRTTSYQTIFLF